MNLQPFLPYVPLLVFIVFPIWGWLFRLRLVRKEDVDEALKKEREAWEKVTQALGQADADLSAKVQALHTDNQVMRVHLQALPTREDLTPVTQGLARLTGLLEGRLQGFERVQDAVARHDDIIAEAARAARRVPGGE
jgi:hypothetical protein